MQIKIKRIFNKYASGKYYTVIVNNKANHKVIEGDTSTTEKLILP